MILSFVYAIRFVGTFLCFSLLLGAAPLLAQKVKFEPVYHNITTEHGLPSMETYSVKQDSKGYIWICTDAGVCRYDGFEFRTFTTKDGLTDNVVFNTYEDSRGRIWFLTYNSMLCYWDNGKISYYRYNDEIKKYLGNRSASSKELFFDENGTMYYSLYTAGVIKIDEQGRITQLDKHEEDFVVLREKNRLLISRYYPLLKRTYVSDAMILAKQSNKIYQKIGVFTTAQSFGTTKHIDGKTDRYFFIDNKVYDYQHLENGPIVEISGLLDLQLVDSMLWLSTLDGLHLARKEGNAWRIVESCLQGFAITGIMFDASGDVWASTLDKGVLFIPDMNVSFAREKQGYTIRDPRSVVKWKESIWVSGITAVRSIRGEEIKIPNGYALEPKLITIGENLIISDPQLSGDNNSLCRIEKNQFGVDFYHNLKEHNGDLIACNQGSIVRGDILTRKLDYIYRSSGKGANKGLKHHYLTALCIDASGQIIVGSKTGVYLLKNQALYSMNLPMGVKPDVVDLIWDTRWGLIIATTNSGILVFRDGKLKSYNEGSGLINDRVNCIAMDKDGTLLVGTPTGISLLKPQGESGTFGINDAMGNIDVSVIFPSDNNIYIATKTSLLKISRKTLAACMKPIQKVEVRIHAVGIDHRFQKPSGVLIVPSGSNHLQVDFSVLQFDNWFSKKYQYRIGKEGHWVDIESPSINLYRPSGEFDIEIRYMDADFRWSDCVKLCHVEVLVPFWMRWYFWIMVVFVLVVMILYLYQRRQNQINQRLMRENQILQLEQQMLMQQQQMEQARMNPHFIFNVLNSIHSYILHEETDQAEKYLMMFSRLMREILVKAKEGMIAVSDECSVLEKYLELEQLRFKGKFSFHILVEPEDLHKTIPSMFVQPFVENAVLHGVAKSASQNAEIRVKFESENNQCMKVTISNSGVISAEDRARLEQSGDKNAFGITKKRLANYNTLLKSVLFGIELTVVNDQKPKTLIILRIPIL